MPSVLLTVFFVQLAIYIVNSLGAAAVSELAWTVYNKFPTPTSAAAHKSSKQRSELLRLKKELSSISAQDDFARWAKLRRQHDKASEEYNNTSASLSSSKTKFTTAAGSVRWASTNGLRLFLLYWYSRAPLFWIPRGWFPGWVEWILSWPRAPLGSVSVQMWSAACASVIGMIGDCVVAACRLIQVTPVASQNEEPQAMGANTQSSPRATKEL